MPHRFYRLFILSLLCLLFISSSQLFAQNTIPHLAFINSANQLVIVSADGNTRWIATNPGEQLHNPLAFSLSPDGSRVFYAVNGGNQAALRMITTADGAVQEIANLAGNLSGGDWLNNRAVLISDGEVLYQCQTNCDDVLSGSRLELISPIMQSTSGISSDTGEIFFNSGTGYVILRPDSGDVLQTGISGDITARGSGQWADDAPLVAYEGTDDNGRNVLQVAHANTENTLSLIGDSRIPFTVIGWLPDNAALLYRDSTGTIRLADVSCLNNGCSDSPLENSVVVASAAADNLQMRDDALFFIADNSVQALSLNCVATNNCLDSTITLAMDAMSRTMLSVADNTLIYTAQSGNSADVRFVDLNCLPDCNSELLLSGAIGGALSDNGDYLAVELIGNGLYILNMRDLNTVFLSVSGRQPGTLLNTVRWGE
ncbi:MAG: hypothetical protein ACPG7F_02335 [Aggregatilineales bacterium]